MSERIAVITTSYPRQPGDAAGHFVHSEVKRLLRAGHEVHVFAPGSGGAASDGATVHWLAIGGAFGWPGALARLKERPRRWLGAFEFCLRARSALRRQAPVHARASAFPRALRVADRARPAHRRRELELVGHGSDVRVFCRLPSPLRRQIARAWLARRATLRVTSASSRSSSVAQTQSLPRPLRVEPRAQSTSMTCPRATSRARRSALAKRSRWR